MDSPPAITGAPVNMGTHRHRYVTHTHLGAHAEGPDVFHGRGLELGLPGLEVCAEHVARVFLGVCFRFHAAERFRTDRIRNEG